MWAAGVDAYITAARLAGYKPTERELWDYHSASLGFGRLFGVDGTGCTSVAQTEAMASRLMGRLTPSQVPPGGWVSLMQVTNAAWFRSGNTVTQADVIRAIEEATPSALVAALRRS